MFTLQETTTKENCRVGRCRTGEWTALTWSLEGTMMSNLDTSLVSSERYARYECHLVTSSPDRRPLSSARRTP